MECAFAKANTAQFFSALSPPQRPLWARRMTELLAPGGRLVCLEFPRSKPSSEPGPPVSRLPISYLPAGSSHEHKFPCVVLSQSNSDTVPQRAIPNSSTIPREAITDTRCCSGRRRRTPTWPISDGPVRSPPRTSTAACSRTRSWRSRRRAGCVVFCTRRRRGRTPRGSRRDRRLIVFLSGSTAEARRMGCCHLNLINHYRIILHDYQSCDLACKQKNKQKEALVTRRSVHLYCRSVNPEVRFKTDENRWEPMDIDYSTGLLPTSL